MTTSQGLILLDRDGVLNRVVIDPEQGIIDSPQHSDQVEVFPWVPMALLRLNQAGYGLAVVTNQPAAAKGKTTRQNLIKVHEKVLSLAQASGARILSSHICYHHAEDGCSCRKPKTGLLQEAFERNRPFERGMSWLVGDGVTDIQAGVACSIKTAFLGPKKCDSCKVLEDLKLNPDFWGSDLKSFVDHLLMTTRMKP